MRILAANKKDWTHPKSGGAEINLRETLTRLADKGHEVHLITSRYPGSDPQVEIDGVKIHRYGVKGRTNELYIFSIGQIHLNRLILKLDPDVMYLTNSIMTWVSLFKREKIVLGIHHVNGKTLLRQMNFPLNLIGYFSEKIALFLSKNEEKVTVSSRITQELVKKGMDKDKITETRNGVDSGRYGPGKKADQPTVLYLGRLEYSKGVDLLPEIHEKIENSFGDYNLEIAGFGRREEEIKEFADREENVSFHGYVSEEKKKELLRSSWILAVPSRREGWGLTVAEAAASGTPAVGFKTGGLQNSIKDGETGKLISCKPLPEENTEKFGKAVAEILEDNRKRGKLRKKAINRAKTLEWSKTAKRLEKLFKKVKRQ